jgi:hypothetical protein
MKYPGATIPLALCLFLSLFGAAPLFAQLTIGVKGGINGATEKFSTVNVYFNPPSTYGYYTHTALARGFGGLFLNYRLQKPFSFQAEFIVSGEGDNLKNTTTGAVYKDRQTFVNLPLMARYHFFRNTYVEAGVFIGYLLAAKANYNSGGVYDGTTVDSKDRFKGAQSGLALGLGHEFQRGILRHFGVNIRSLRDVGSIAKPGTTSIGQGNIRNRNLNIGISYRWLVTKE